MDSQLQLPLGEGTVEAESETEPYTAPVATETPTKRGPRGTRIGDMVLAEGTHWIVAGFDFARHEANCRLIGGSGELRRFRARRILKVERGRVAGMSKRSQRERPRPAD
jgi:hypothetical protein